MRGSKAQRQVNCSIDADLLRVLEYRAHRQGISLYKLLQGILESSAKVIQDTYSSIEVEASNDDQVKILKFK